MAYLPPRARLRSAFPEGGALAARADAAGRTQLWLGPQSVRVLVVDTGAVKAGKAAKARKGSTGAKAKARSSKARARPAAKKQAGGQAPALSAGLPAGEGRSASAAGSINPITAATPA